MCKGLMVQKHDVGLNRTCKERSDLAAVLEHGGQVQGSEAVRPGCACAQFIAAHTRPLQKQLHLHGTQQSSTSTLTSVLSEPHHPYSGNGGLQSCIHMRVSYEGFL